MVALKAKNYALLTDIEYESKKAKGVKRSVLAKEISFQDYKNVLFNDETITKK